MAGNLRLHRSRKATGPGNPKTPGHKNKQGAAYGRGGSRPISDRVRTPICFGPGLPICFGPTLGWWVEVSESGVVVCGVACWVLVVGGDEVVDGDRFVAVRAWCSGAEACAEGVAVGAALGAEVAGLAVGAAVDGVVAGGFDRHVRHSVALPPGCLSAGVAAVAAPA